MRLVLGIERQRDLDCRHLSAAGGDHRRKLFEQLTQDLARMRLISDRMHQNGRRLLRL
jgi:hypothetical protein